MTQICNLSLPRYGSELFACKRTHIKRCGEMFLFAQALNYRKAQQPSHHIAFQLHL